MKRDGVKTHGDERDKETNEKLRRVNEGGKKQSSEKKPKQSDLMERETHKLSNTFRRFHCA